MPRPANLDHPVYVGLTARERAALMRDYAHASADQGTVPEMIRRTGPAVFAAVWLAIRRARECDAEAIRAALTSREREAAMLDHEYADEQGLPDIELAGWIVAYRAHQGKRRRARWPDEQHPPETAAEIRDRKRAARLRRREGPREP